MVAEIPDGCHAFGLGADPTGTRLAVTVSCADDPDRSGIWVTDAEGVLAPLVTEGSTGIFCEYSPPTWSAAGTAVAYHRVAVTAPVRTSQVWVAQVADGAVTVQDAGAFGVWPSLAPPPPG